MVYSEDSPTHPFPWTTEFLEAVYFIQFLYILPEILRN